MSLAQAITTILGCFIVPSGLGWVASQVMHREKVAAFRRGKEQAEKQSEDYLPPARVKLLEDLAWNGGFFEGMKCNGVALRAANGRFTHRDALFAK